MSRSNWKGPFISESLIKQKNIKKEYKKVWSRNSTITSNYIDKKVAIHNGKFFINVFITKEISSYNFIPYSFGSNLIETVIINGKVIN